MICFLDWNEHQLLSIVQLSATTEQVTKEDSMVHIMEYIRHPIVPLHHGIRIIDSLPFTKSLSCSIGDKYSHNHFSERNIISGRYWFELNSDHYCKKKKFVLNNIHLFLLRFSIKELFLCCLI